MTAGASRRERGFTLVLFSLTLVGLLVFAAFAVDLGALYNHRRQDQNAADAAALAAAARLGDSAASIVADAKYFAHTTLGVTLATADWNTCDGDPGALRVVAAGANCVSYDNRRVRVRIPDQQYATTFGSVVGADEFRHGAFAIGALRPEGFGSVLPYAVTGSSAEGGFGCLQSNSNGQASSWCGSTTGNFGFMDFSHYGDEDMGTTQSCGSGEFNLRLRNNTAMGVDHDVTLAADDPATTIVDTTACLTLTPSPDAANTQTGNAADDITEGLFYRTAAFPDGEPSRLRRRDERLFGTGGDEVTVFDRTDVDNNNLWRFIPSNYGPGESTSADIPASCKRDQFVDGSGNFYSTSANNPDVPDGIESFLRSSGFAQPRDRILGLLARCFTHYRGQAWNGAPLGSLQTPEAPTGCGDGNVCSAPVFARNTRTDDVPNLYDIQYTPRFGYVPQLASFPSGTSEARQFIRFRPIYIYRLLFEHSGGTTIFDPGVAPMPPTTGSYSRIGETSVFVFPDGMLPGRLASQDAPFAIGVNRFIRLVR